MSNEKILPSWQGFVWKHDAHANLVFICPDDKMPLEAIVFEYDSESGEEVGYRRRVKPSTDLSPDNGDYLICPVCEKNFVPPCYLSLFKQRCVDFEASKNFKDYKIIDLADERFLVAKEALTNEEAPRYSIQVKLYEDEAGYRSLLVYVTDKQLRQDSVAAGKAHVHLFVDEKQKQLRHDKNDVHPHAVFMKLEATFADGSKSSMARGDNEKGKAKKRA